MAVEPARAALLHVRAHGDATYRFGALVSGPDRITIGSDLDSATHVHVAVRRQSAGCL